MAQNNHPLRDQRKQSADEIGTIEDVLRLYNTVAEPFMDAKNGINTTNKNLKCFRESAKCNHLFLILLMD